MSEFNHDLNRLTTVLGKDETLDLLALKQSHEHRQCRRQLLQSAWDHLRWSVADS
jgi:hypothetical protein